MQDFKLSDLTEVFDEVERAATVFPYRDPLMAPFGDPERTTITQAKAWNFLKQKDGDGPLIAMIGAKSSAKTHFGACFAAHMGQMYPGSLGCLISNTYGQAKDNAAPIFRKVMRQLGIEAEFFDKKKVKGQPFTHVFICAKDTPSEFYLLVRSFEKINLLEGIEIDWLWVEEGQDTTKDNFRIAFSRVRGRGADNSMFFAAMPESPFHWEYTFLPELGFRKEGQDNSEGIMYWPKLKENVINQPDKYMERMIKSHTGDQARRYIEGLPSLLDTSLAFYQYDDTSHRTGRMSQVLSVYDPALPLVLTVDFNVSQMCASMWQLKQWNDEWDSRNVFLMDGEIRVGDDAFEGYEVVSSFEEYMQSNREVVAQVDEFEIWSGGTRGLADAVFTKYGRHGGGLTILGDASGNREETSSDTTDWQIFEDRFRGVPHTQIIRGLKTGFSQRTGLVTYYNPSVRNSINIGNWYLRDGEGVVHLCFLPESEFSNGGVAGSVSRVPTNHEGKIDKKIDAIPGKDQPRTHYSDIYRYAVVHFNGSDNVLDGNTFSYDLARVRRGERTQMLGTAF